MKKHSKKDKILWRQKTELENKKAAMIKRFEDSRAIEQTKREQEKEFLNYQNEHLRQFLSSLDTK